MLRAFVAPSHPPGSAAGPRADVAAPSAADNGADDDDVPARGRERLRTVFISDVHLGTPGC